MMINERVLLTQHSGDTVSNMTSGGREHEKSVRGTQTRSRTDCSQQPPASERSFRRKTQICERDIHTTAKNPGRGIFPLNWKGMLANDSLCEMPHFTI